MHFNIYRDNQGEWRWTLYASNGEPLAVSSEGYSDLSDAEHSIDLIKTTAGEARVVHQ